MSKRELIDARTDKRHVWCDTEEKFKELDNVGRSLAQDGCELAKTKVGSGQAIAAIGSAGLR